MLDRRGSLDSLAGTEGEGDDEADLTPEERELLVSKRERALERRMRRRHSVQGRDFSSWEAPRVKDVRAAFDFFDRDGNGVIDLDEIKVAMKKYFALDLSEKEIEGLMLLYDSDGNGTLDFEEFSAMVFNLEDLDPESVARFWAKQVQFIPFAGDGVKLLFKGADVVAKLNPFAKLGKKKKKGGDKDKAGEDDEENSAGGGAAAAAAAGGNGKQQRHKTFMGIPLRKPKEKRL
eukprot:g4110.t1